MHTSQYQSHPKLKYFNEFIIKKDPKEDYKLIKNIGSGTYGEVYKAANRRTSVFAAIKIVKVDIKDDVKAIAQEIHTLRDCHHQNIVEYFGSYLRRNKLWICMEFCGGFSMQDIYTNIRRSLDEQCIAFVTRETLRGLAYMHSQGKIHRDIKGANILLTENGLVKIADFGVAAQITQTIQKRSSFIGTPYWMAPEVAAVERKGGYDEKCDIWAVGITAMEYAELQPPMFDLHPMKALHLLSLRSYKPPVLQNKNKWTSKFHTFLKECLNKNERRRPDAETMLKSHFTTNPNLGVHLTRDLLQLNRNPGRIPLVPNDEEEDDEFQGLVTLSREDDPRKFNENMASASQQKTKMPPADKIKSTRRDLKHSCIEDMRFKIELPTSSNNCSNDLSEVDGAPGAPLCQPEDLLTLALQKQHSSSPDTPITPTANKYEELVTPTNSSPFKNYNEHETTNSSSNNESTKNSNGIVSLALSPAVRNQQVEAFGAYNDVAEDKSSDISNESSENPPTPPPKRNNTQPPPIPPLPFSKKHLRNLSSNSSSNNSSHSGAGSYNSTAETSLSSSTTKPIKTAKTAYQRPARKNSADDLLSSNITSINDNNEKDYKHRYSHVYPLSTTNASPDVSPEAKKDFPVNREEIPPRVTRPPAPTPPYDDSQPPPIPPHTRPRSISSPESSNSSSSSNQNRDRKKSSDEKTRSSLQVTNENRERQRSPKDNKNRQKSSKDKKNSPDENRERKKSPNNDSKKPENMTGLHEEESLLDQSRKKALGQGLPLTPRVTMGACFSLIFEGCPLKINASATWVNPLTNSQIIIFGTNDGIYYLSLDDLADSTLNLLFPRRCLWLYIVKNTMMSLSGQHPQLYNHNLLYMFKLSQRDQILNLEKKIKLQKFFPKRHMPTTKVPDTRGCLQVSVTRNPYNGAKYLCAALATNEILVMEWFNPLSTFLEVRRVCTAPTCRLPVPLLNFDLLVLQDRSLPIVCLGIYPSSSNNSSAYKFHLLDLNPPSVSMEIMSNDATTNIVDCTPPPGEAMIVNKVIQVEYKTVLIAFQNSVVITDLKGRLKASQDNKISEIPFPNGTESIVCLSDSILAFNQHGLTGKSFSGQLTQEIYDENSIYRLIGSDKNIVVEKRPRDEPMNDSNIYVLAGHTDSI